MNMRFIARVMTFIAALSTVGCAFKMGNTQLDIFEGLNHPTVTVEKTEKVTPPNVSK